RRPARGPLRAAAAHPRTRYRSPGTTGNRPDLARAPVPADVTASAPDPLCATSCSRATVAPTTPLQSLVESNVQRATRSTCWPVGAPTSRPLAAPGEAAATTELSSAAATARRRAGIVLRNMRIGVRPDQGEPQCPKIW